MKSKLVYVIAPMMVMMLLTTFAVAVSASYSLREAPGEALDVSVNSNGDRGRGSIVDTSGEDRVTHYLSQRSGVWIAKTQVGRERGSYVPVTVVYDSVAGTLTIPELGIVANVINLKA